jgi:putative methyltransferase (TIGR04325 family)
MEFLYVGRFDSLHESTQYLNEYTDYSSETQLSNAYSTSRWLLRQEKFLELSLQGQYPRPSNLRSFVEQLSIKSILDIGGGSGWVSTFLPTDTIYRNFELADTRLHFCKKFDFHSQYISTMNEIHLFNPQLVYSNSVLQYFSDLGEFMDLLRVANPQHVLLDDLYLTSEKTFYSLQRYYETYIPTVFLNEVDFLEQMFELKYQKISEKEFTPILTQSMKQGIDLLNGEYTAIPISKSLTFSRL